MSLNPDHLAVQSYCFRNEKDNAKVASMVRQIGLDRIEVCAVHADFNEPEKFTEVVEAYRNRGVGIVSLGVQGFTGDEATERRWFECAKLAGARHLSAHVDVDSFEKALEVMQGLAEEFDMKVGLHNHGGYHFHGSQAVNDHLFQLAGDRIGLCLDTAWALHIGPGQGNPVDWARKYSARLWQLHLKDFIFDRNAQHHDVVVGKGNLDLPAMLTMLESKDFAGQLVVEYEADPDNPVPALTDCVKAIKETMQGATA